MNLRTASVGLGAVVAIAIAIWVYRKGVGGVASSVARSTVNAATGAAKGVVIGAGEVVGIPATDVTKCSLAKNAGDTFAASQYCEAGDFLSWWLGNLGGSGSLNNAAHVAAGTTPAEDTSTDWMQP